MAVTLTVGTNTYATLAEAVAYMATRLGAAAWDAATADNQAKALIGAYQALEALRWEGTPTVSTQPGQWPRSELYDVNGNEYATTTMPAWLIAAQCEEALALLELAADPDVTVRRGLQRQGVSRVKLAEGVEEDYKPAQPVAGLHSQEAYRLVRRYLLRAPARVDSSM